MKLNTWEFDWKLCAHRMRKNHLKPSLLISVIPSTTQHTKCTLWSVLIFHYVCLYVCVCVCVVRNMYNAKNVDICIYIFHFAAKFKVNQSASLMLPFYYYFFIYYYTTHNCIGPYTDKTHHTLSHTRRWHVIATSPPSLLLLLPPLWHTCVGLHQT